MQVNGSAVVALPLSARDVDRFTPEGAKDRNPPPVYLIAVPSVLGKAQWQKAMSALGAQYWPDSVLRETLRDGVNLVVDEDQRTEILATLDRDEDIAKDIERLSGIAADEPAQPAEEGEAAPVTPLQRAIADRAALGKELAEIERVVARYYPRYREMVSDRQFWIAAAPALAGRHFVRGWENGAVPFRKGSDGLVVPAAFDALPQPDQLAIGWRAIALMNTGASAKN